MARTRRSDEDVIVQYMTERPLGEATLMLDVARSIVRTRSKPVVTNGRTKNSNLRTMPSLDQAVLISEQTNGSVPIGPPAAA